MKTLMIDVLNNEGEVVLSIQPYTMPKGMSVKDYVDEMMPGFHNIYQCKCFYVYVEDKHIQTH